MTGYRIKIDVVAVSIEHAVGLAQQAAKYLPDSWSVGSAIGNVDVTVEPCVIGSSEDDEPDTAPPFGPDHPVTISPDMVES